MPPTSFKFNKAGRETRRHTFTDQPTWLTLETKIAVLFDIPPGMVAVGYVDNDGDNVIVSTQDELQDYFANVHTPGESVKFTVVDLRELRSARGETSGMTDEFDTGSGLPTMGPTMVFDVDDDWQRVPGIPNIFAVHSQDDLESEGHAFVETVDSSVSGSKKPSEHSASEQSSLSSLSHPSTERGKGKEREPMSEQSKSTSIASIIENDSPRKPAVHVFDVSDAGGLSPRIGSTTMRSPILEPFGASSRTYFSSLVFHMVADPTHVCTKEIPVQPRYSAFGGGAAEPFSPLGPRSPIYAADLAEQAKPLPKTPSSRPVSFHPLSTTHSAQTTPRQPTVPDLADPPLAATGEGPPVTAIPNSAPSFANDVANLLDSLTAAFAAHPELSEGLRNIVRNTAQGVYFPVGRERVASAAENMRMAAENTSGRIARAVENLGTTSEQEAGRRIAQSLEGVFRIIGELSTGISSLSTTAPGGQEVPPPPPPPEAQGQMMPGGWPGMRIPPPPPPPNSFYGGPPPPPHRFGYGMGRFARYGRPPHMRPSFSGGPGHPFAPPPGPPPPGPPPPPIGSRVPGENGFSGLDRPVPWGVDRPVDPPQRSASWSAGRTGYAPAYYGEPTYDMYGDAYAPTLDAHESKAQLEAAKALYKAEKERFRQIKDERRRLRQEAQERRAEEGNVPRPE